MQRGVLVLPKEELTKLREKINTSSCSNQLLCGKIDEAYLNIQNENRVFLSEEELEEMLDIIGIGDQDSVLQSTTQKLNDQLRSIRGI